MGIAHKMDRSRNEYRHISPVHPVVYELRQATHKMQFAEKHTWIPNWNINYFLGVDGISVLFVLLSTLTAILCVLISWESIKTKVKEFYISILLTTSFMIGVFCSLDFFLFYLFWEAMLIPMFLIIGVWGGPNRIYAAIKFFLYTLVGSVLMLVGIIVLYFYSGKTFNILDMMTKTYPYTMQMWLFWAFFAAFAVKVPMWPVHTWLPDAHTEAPTAGSVILAAVLIKMGAYGFLRFSLPLLPEASKGDDAGNADPFRDRNYLRRRDMSCADRSEKTYCIQFGEPYGLCDSRNLCPEHPGT